jgi:hypothetical protein
MLYATLACAAMFALVPVFVWGATGSWRHAMFALREYWVAMACIWVPTLSMVAAVLISEAGG